jgi:hypothetical protein
MRRIRRYAKGSFPWLFFLLFAAPLVIVLPSCGGSSSSTPTPVSTPIPPPPPVSRVILEGAEPGVEPLTLIWLDFNTSATGALDATVDWTSASNDVDVYLAQGTEPCTLQAFNSGDCPFIASSQTTTDKPETCSTPSAAAGPYILYFANWGPGRESISFQVVLTTRSASSGSPVTKHVGRDRKKGLVVMRHGG